MKIPIFDIDWTLLAKSEPKIHHEAFLHALKVLYNLELGEGIFKEGSIDNKILYEAAIEQGINKDRVLDDLENARNLMIEYFEKNKHGTVFDPMPGVLDLLTTLVAANIPRGLLTGNVEKIGWEKLRLGGIDQFFQFGAFGSMAMTRPELVPLAAERASIALGRKVEVFDLVIIGDTPLDVACGKEGGAAFTIAVATCPKYSYEVLKKSDADLVIKDMTEIDKILEILKK